MNENTGVRISEEALAQLPDLVRGLRDVSRMLKSLGWSTSVKEKAKRVFTLALEVVSDCNPKPMDSGDLRRFRVEFDFERLNERDLCIVTPIATALPQLGLVMDWNRDPEPLAEENFSLIDPKKLSGCAELLEREIPAHRGSRSDGEQAKSTGVGRKTRRRGRQQKYDPKEAARLADAWFTGQYKDRKDLARGFGMDLDEVKRALERDRHKRPERWKEASARRKESSE